MRVQSVAPSPWPILRDGAARLLRMRMESESKILILRSRAKRGVSKDGPQVEFHPHHLQRGAQVADVGRALAARPRADRVLAEPGIERHRLARQPALLDLTDEAVHEWIESSAVSLGTHAPPHSNGEVAASALTEGS